MWLGTDLDVPWAEHILWVAAVFFPLGAIVDSVTQCFSLFVLEYKILRFIFDVQRGTHSMFEELSHTGCFAFPVKDAVSFLWSNFMI